MSSRNRAPSQRQLRVGELVRHALSEVLARGDIRDPALAAGGVTVVEVQATPDLRHANAYVMPLGGDNAEQVLAALEKARKFIRGQVGKRIELKYMPELYFHIDRSFDNFATIDRLLADPRVRRDVEGGNDGGA